MPIEIRELVIKATIEEKPNSGNPAADKTALPAPTPDFERIVAECVAQVMEILKQQKER